MSHDSADQIDSAPSSPTPSHSSMADPHGQQPNGLQRQNGAYPDPNGQPRQNGAYPSPHSYPSPSMQSAYAYPPPQQGQQSHEAYRGSPQDSHNALPSLNLNLPPIRQLDGQQAQQQQQQQPMQQPMGSPLPPPQHGMPQYYPHQAHPPPGQQMGIGNMGPAQYNAGMRYVLPPQHDQRVLSGGRHKKEIKRRTKTGCLTCRKRRIKCDEAHPMCRNCQKSKRECLGYDPIFKQQPGPAQIQPAPNSAPASHSTPPAAAPAPSAPSTYSESSVPQGYAPASSSNYASTASATSGAHPSGDFNAIDPALAAPQGQSMHQGQPPYNGSNHMDPAMRGPPGGQSYQHPPLPPPEPTRGKRLNIVDIFGICNHSPPAVPPRATPIPPETDEEFTKIFINDYCQGLDYTLQTTWFTANNHALDRVFSDRALHEEAAFFTETMKINRGASDMAGVFSQEARLIWHLLCTCKHVMPTANGYPEHEDLYLREVRARLDVLECLLTNQNLVSNPLRQLPYPPDLPNEKRSEIDFWMYLGEFVQASGAEHVPPGAADYALAGMRNVLLLQEVRDAIYSIAIARHCGSRVPGFPNALPPAMNPQEDNDLNKLVVAMGFISLESRQSSQQVLARICDMAMLSWAVARSP